MCSNFLVDAKGGRKAIGDESKMLCVFLHSWCHKCAVHMVDKKRNSRSLLENQSACMSNSHPKAFLTTIHYCLCPLHWEKGFRCKVSSHSALKFHFLSGAWDMFIKTFFYKPINQLRRQPLKRQRRATAKDDHLVE